MERQDYFNEVIRVGRLLRGATYGQLSEGTGIPIWRLRAFEKGISPVRPEEFLMIWRFLSSDEVRPVPEGSPARGNDTGLLVATKSERP